MAKTTATDKIGRNNSITNYLRNNIAKLQFICDDVFGIVSLDKREI